MFYGYFLFPTQWYWLDDHQRRFRLLSGEGQVKIRLRSGQKRSNFEVDIFAYKRYLFDAAHHGKSNGGLSFVVRDQQGQKYSLIC